jgi:hypothetical protein
VHLGNLGSVVPVNGLIDKTNTSFEDTTGKSSEAHANLMKMPRIL